MISDRHPEKHITSSEILQDMIIGMADGLTVPFALAAGLSGAIDSTSIVLAAGAAEIAAGAIAMGLGGYLSAKTAIEHYNSEETREFLEIEAVPETEAEEVADILREFGVNEAQIPTVVSAIISNPKKWVEFMMRFELGLEKPNPKRMIYSPITIGLSYVFGGIIPLFPYMFTSNITEALNSSIVATIIALVVFGGLKGYFIGTNVIRSSLQTTFIGGVAATAAFTIAKLIT